MTGELLGRGPQLLFAPRGDGASNKRLRAAGGVFYIWNVAENRGLILNEALQGYAHLTNEAALPNMVVRPESAAAPETTLEGHPCRAEQVTISTGEGLPETCTVWRATDLKGLPLSIISGTNPVPFKLHLSKVRLEQPSAELFRPPEGFTRYESAQAMMGELAIRQQGSRRKDNEPARESKPEDQWGDRARHPY